MGFQYKKIITALSAPLDEKQLNELGAENWELKDKSDNVYIFMRMFDYFFSPDPISSIRIESPNEKNAKSYPKSKK